MLLGYLISLKSLFGQLRWLTLQSLFVLFAISYVYYHIQQFKINSDIHRYDPRNIGHISIDDNSILVKTHNINRSR